MAITQEVNVDLVEKLIDGNFKIKYPKTIVSQIKDLTGIATKAEAEVGIGNTQIMTPLRAKEMLMSNGLTRAVDGSVTGVNTITVNIGFQPKLVWVYNMGDDEFEGATKTATGFTVAVGSNQRTIVYIAIA